MSLALNTEEEQQLITRTSLGDLLQERHVAHVRWGHNKTIKEPLKQGYTGCMDKKITGTGV